MSFRASFAAVGDDATGFDIGQGRMQTLRWLRMPGDTLFAFGQPLA